MSLVKCVVCEHEISDQAAYCIKCGHPLNNNQTSSSDISGIWHTVTKTRTPINIFALAMMACASVLGASATQISNCYSLTAFTYSIHSFIAVSGMFFLAILFSRKGIYHPKELDKVSVKTLADLGKDKPIIAALLIVTMMSAYGYYQYTISDPCVVGTAASGK